MFHRPCCCNAAANASLCCKITVSCSKGIRTHDVDAHCRKLSLSLGNVTEDSTLACFCPSVKIRIPSCVTDKKQKVFLKMKKPCQRLCTNHLIWTSTVKKASVSKVHTGDTITYMVTFTNNSSYTLNMVRIFDTVPAEVTVISDSIRPVPKPGETLQTGISIGRVEPGDSVTLKYSVTVESDASGCIVNTAYVQYDYIDCKGCCLHGTGSCKRCTIKILPTNPSLCKCIKSCFPICNFDRFQCCSVHHTDLISMNHTGSPFVKAGFCIVVKYIDSFGEKRVKCFKSHVVFSDLPNNFDSTHVAVKFTNLVCHVDRCGNISARLNAKLYYQISSTN